MSFILRKKGENDSRTNYANNKTKFFDGSYSGDKFEYNDIKKLSKNHLKLSYGSISYSFSL